MSALAPDPSLDLTEVSAGAPGQRAFYLGLLGSIALLNLFVCQAVSWVWQPLAFPSQGVLFVLGGSVIASSLDHANGSPWPVLAKSARRLLPPFWLMGAILVPTMLAAGWSNENLEGQVTWNHALYWLLPLNTPPTSDLGLEWVAGLWFIRTCLWLVLLSPATLWLFRRWPRPMLGMGLLIAGMFTVGLPPVSGPAREVVMSVSVFAGCWLVGYAEHDGILRAIPMQTIARAAITLLAAGLGVAWWLHPAGMPWWEVSETPLALALCVLGLTVLLMRFNPSLAWVQRRALMTRFMSGANARAVTLYLWMNMAIWAAGPVLNSNWLIRSLWRDSWGGTIPYLATSFVIWLACAFLFGWVEDLAAGRRVRINPWRRTRDKQIAEHPPIPSVSDGQSVSSQSGV